MIATLAFVLVTAPTPASASSAPVVTLETNKGTIEVRLYADAAPVSTKNFLDYVDAGFYDGTIFHRVIPGFMVQGGGYTADLQTKPVHASIKNEAANGKSNRRGTLAMARTGVVDSATSQFFINVVDNARLDHQGTNPRDYGYAVFGEVVSGMEVVDAITKVARRCPTTPPVVPCDPTGLPPGMRDVPADPVVITKARRKKG